jgi:hypothetical protein
MNKELLKEFLFIFFNNIKEDSSFFFIKAAYIVDFVRSHKLNNYNDNEYAISNSVAAIMMAEFIKDNIDIFTIWGFSIENRSILYKNKPICLIYPDGSESLLETW